MNVETLATENAETLSGEHAATRTPQQAADITPLPLDSFKLVGGGSGIIVE